jgi:outer membrane lipoprotein
VRSFDCSRIFPLLLLVGCTTPPIDAINRAPPGDPSLVEVRAQIEESIGKRVRWGGSIVATENRTQDTQIVIVTRPLDDYGRPQATGESLGRFIARVQGFLDPAVYDRNREITIAGVVDGSVTRSVGDYQYVYVLVRAEAVKLWEPQVVRRYYDRDPFYDPFWPGRVNPWFSPYPFYPYWR